MRKLMIILLLLVACTGKEAVFSQEESQEIAANYIQELDEFIEGLEILEVNDMKCSDCWSFQYKFEGIEGEYNAIVILNHGVVGEIVVKRLSILNFEDCVAAGYPILESFPAKCKTSDGELFVEVLTCEKLGGKYLESENECEGISEVNCLNLGGTYDECASACRNDDESDGCIAVCIEVCNLDIEQKVPECNQSEWCDDKQMCLTIFECNGTIINFDNCVAAGFPILESYPRQCMNENGDVFIEEIVEEEHDCVADGGKYLVNYNECEYISKDLCDKLGGDFVDCASACRHDPDAEFCTMDCVPVCTFGSITGGLDEYGCVPTAGYQWCEEKQKCLRIWEENCSNILVDGYTAEGIVIDYIENSEEYVNGRDIEIISTKMMRCIGCYSVVASFIVDIDVDSEFRQYLITILNWEIADVNTDYAWSVGECSAVGGETIKTLDIEDCEGEYMGVVAGFDNPTICCKSESQFCGTSTYGKCYSNRDCVEGGCSGQICESVRDDSMETTCEYLDCYDDTKYDVECGCIDSMCQWS